MPRYFYSDREEPINKVSKEIFCISPTERLLLTVGLVNVLKIRILI